MVTIVLLKEAWMCTTPWGTCLRSFFLNFFCLPFFSGAAPVPAAAAFAMSSLSVVRCPFFVRRSHLRKCHSYGERKPENRQLFFRSLPSISSSALLCPCAVLCACERSCAYADHEPASCGDAGIRDRNRFR